MISDDLLDSTYLLVIQTLDCKFLLLLFEHINNIREMLSILRNFLKVVNICAVEALSIAVQSLLLVDVHPNWDIRVVNSFIF